MVSFPRDRLDEWQKFVATPIGQAMHELAELGANFEFANPKFWGWLAITCVEVAIGFSEAVTNVQNEKPWSMQMPESTEVCHEAFADARTVATAKLPVIEELVLPAASTQLGNSSEETAYPCQRCDAEAAPPCIGHPFAGGSAALHQAARLAQPDAVKALLHLRADASVVNHSGVSPWMVIGEVAQNEQAVVACVELLKPEVTPQDLLKSAEANIDDFLGSFHKPVTVDLLRRQMRLHETLFGPCSAEDPLLQQQLIERWVAIIKGLLTLDPLDGERKVLARYLLNAIMGPRYHHNQGCCRERLVNMAQDRLRAFAVECNQLHKTIHAGAKFPASVNNMLLQLPRDLVSVPAAWQVNPYWLTVQRRQVLRYDPPWSVSAIDVQSCLLQLVRLGAVSCVDEFSSFAHKDLRELLAWGYVQYSSLCNEPFQEMVRSVVARACDAYCLRVDMPSTAVPPKKLRRLLEKTLEAEEQRRGLDWPCRSESYLRHACCFYILDTVRFSVVCRGDTLDEQIRCCMHVLKEFKCCAMSKPACLQLLRVKSGFAPDACGEGGYADIKLFCYADVGVHVAVDGQEMPLRIIGEIQLLLEDFAKIKHRMHLAYEISRGSFDWPGATG